MELGAALGAELAEMDGDAIGPRTLGPSLGKLLGVSLGIELGAVLGVPLGSKLGEELGTPLGVRLGMELGTALDNLAVTRIEASKALTHVEENCIMSNDDLFAVSCIVR